MQRPGQEILIRFFRGTCLPEEEYAVKAYLALNIDAEYIENCMHEAFPDLTEHHETRITHEELDRVWNKLEGRRRADLPSRLKPHRSWYAIAAVIAFIVTCSAAFLLLKNSEGNNHSLEVKWRQIAAQTGNPTKVMLGDSSCITLFPGSLIEVPDHFNLTDRKVRLSGRAFFKITHNEKKPFYVLTEKLSTKVLGTTFEVNASKITNENTITLHTGKVSVSYLGKEIVSLKPDQQIKFNKTTGRFKVAAVDAGRTVSWLSGELAYDQAPLKTVVDDLEKWYGIHISVKNQLTLNRKVTISFKDLPVNTVLDMLSKSISFSYTKKDRQITIKERRMERN